MSFFYTIKRKILIIMIKHLTSFIKTVYQNYFEIASCLAAVLIVLIAILMDHILDLQACPLCILTRYIFGVIAVISFIGFIYKKFDLLNKILIIFTSIYGIVISLRLIYIQNLSAEEVAMLPMGCGMPLETQIEYFGFFGGLANVYGGGPTCAEESWRFIFNFAEWGLIFFLVYFICTASKILKSSRQG